MGVGATGIACKNSERRFIGCEIDEKYFVIAKERIENADIYPLETDIEEEFENGQLNIFDFM